MHRVARTVLNDFASMTNKPDDFFVQKTIARPVSVSGIGIHTGREVRLALRPAPADTGVRFRRIDCGVEMPALASYVSSLELATTLGRDGAQVSTVEHLMAAIQVLGIDNLMIEIDGPEVPILDGSALPYCRLLEAADLQPQRALRRIVAIIAPIEIQEGGGRSISITPYPGLRVSYRIDFGDHAIGAQSIDVEVTRDGFERELASARTFALLRDVKRMLERGLALGGDEGNCVVFDEDGPINTTLRYRQRAGTPQGARRRGRSRAHRFSDLGPPHRRARRPRAPHRAARGVCARGPSAGPGWPARPCRSPLARSGPAASRSRFPPTPERPSDAAVQTPRGG